MQWMGCLVCTFVTNVLIDLSLLAGYFLDSHQVTSVIKAYGARNSRLWNQFHLAHAPAHLWIFPSVPPCPQPPSKWAWPAMLLPNSPPTKECMRVIVEATPAMPAQNKSMRPQGEPGHTHTALPSWFGGYWDTPRTSGATNPHLPPLQEHPDSVSKSRASHKTLPCLSGAWVLRGKLERKRGFYDLASLCQTRKQNSQNLLRF